ncbi:hypothetical protein JCGZ_24250 [Jatropha curcas]|uniref:Uncharacterized protein n=1 Tax=Jatropha curcas TaxID=180498 RepID=A0A067JYT0_JATCU|nr:hypothetical protein JCGZ_24250 [Jatropha curcas]
MTSPSHSSDEDFLASLGVSLEDADVTADVNTHTSVTGIYARDSRIKLDVGESSVAEIPIEIFDQHNPVGAIISPSYLGYLTHLDMGSCRVGQSDDGAGSRDAARTNYGLDSASF